MGMLMSSMASTTCFFPRNCCFDGY